MKSRVSPHSLIRSMNRPFTCRSRGNEALTFSPRKPLGDFRPSLPHRTPVLARAKRTQESERRSPVRHSVAKPGAAKRAMMPAALFRGPERRALLGVGRGTRFAPSIARRSLGIHGCTLLPRPARHEREEGRGEGGEGVGAEAAERCQDSPPKLCSHNFVLTNL